MKGHKDDGIRRINQFLTCYIHGKYGMHAKYYGYIVGIIFAFSLQGSLPLLLEWRRGPDSPFEMGFHVHSVLLRETLYVGGGDAYGENDFIIMAYDTRSRKWSTLPPYFAINFAMTAVNNQLVLVGGDNHWYETTKVLFVWKPETNEWSQPFPELPTPRSACSAVGYNSWLIIVGGVSSNFYNQHQDIDFNLPIEVLNTQNKQWHTFSKTPQPWKDMKTAVVGDVCYFMGGSKVRTGYCTEWAHSVYGLSLPALLSVLRDHSTDESSSMKHLWKNMPKLEFSRASPLCLNGSLFALGGVDYSQFLYTSSIFLYLSDCEQWQKVADLPEVKIDCTCVMIPDGNVMVAAGFGEEDKGHVRVDLARIR